MAAAKKTMTLKTAKKTAPKKTAPKKKSAKKKSTSAKSATRKSATLAAKKSTTKKAAGSTSSRKPAGSSVDSILKQFEKQRSDHQAKLTVVRKKIAQLEAKTKAYLAEIVTLKQQEETSAQTISTLDVQRDEAVRKQLEKLGVSLTPPQTKSPKKANKNDKKKTKKTTAKKKASNKSRASKSKGGPSVLSFEQSAESLQPKIESTPLFDSEPHSNSVNGSGVDKDVATANSDELLTDDDRDVTAN